ncbi:MipA/OmpV family protein [Caldimonas brevitalea]|uniref:MipA/OmpV family protein n=1 Tax=Caldimonas brevitalea TaxID=413882 RepID=A0A0G3BJH3_9BURK|nr:MipA/OmpV family protein [Caldimonas brevitalea]AKJ27526.1 hypothetical protein AAW51_0835 [Caldimonas brevitalea]
MSLARLSAPAIAVWLGAVLLPLASAAQTMVRPSPATSPATQKNWSVMLGVGATWTPDYQGSEDHSTSAIPLLHATVKTSIGRFGLGDIPGPRGPFVTYTFHESAQWSLGVGMGREPGRRERDASGSTPGSETLRGMGEIDSATAYGLFAIYRLEGWRLTGVWRGVSRSDGHGGRLADVQLSYTLPAIGRLVPEVSGGFTWADDRYMQSLFGVSAEQSARSGYAVYSAGSGVRDYSATLGARYRVTPEVVLLGRLGVSRLAGDAANSPIVQDKVQPSALLGVAYQW